MGLIVLDTTVLLYAVGEDHTFREPCRRLVDAIGNGFEATTTVEVIQEFVHVRSRRRTRLDASRLARVFARTLAPLLVTTADDLVEGLTVYEEQPSLGAFDSILAATAIRRGTDAFLSADRAFGTVPGLTHVVPGSPEFDALLS